MSDIVQLNKDVEPYVLQTGLPRSKHYFKDEIVPLTLVHLSDVHGPVLRLREQADHRGKLTEGTC